MSGCETITATEFKAKFLQALDRVNARKVDRVTITKRGVPVAVLLPPEPAPVGIDAYFKFLRDQTVFGTDVDLVDPIADVVWDAELGILHR